jgi:hypothetical protein
MDILSGSYDGDLYCYYRKPNGTYAAGEIMKDAGGSPIKIGRATAITAGDLDGDGDFDLVVGNMDGAVFRVTNEGTPKKPAFGRPEPLKAGKTAITADGGLAGPCLADWDGDGKLDLLVGSSSGKVSWCRNIGSKTKPEFAPEETLVEAVPTGLQSDAAFFDNPKRSGGRAKVCVSDWNGDGRPDLLVGDFTSAGNGQYHGWVWVHLRQAKP